jgi:hypothetical protein
MYQCLHSFRGQQTWQQYAAGEPFKIPSLISGQFFFLSKTQLDRNAEQGLMLCSTKPSFFMNIYQTQYFKQAADLSESKSKYCHRQTCLSTGKHPILSFECNLKVQSERTRSETILAQEKEIFSTSSICSSQTVL